MAVSRINEAGLNVNQYGNRNVIYNGAMKVAQRGTSSTGLGAAAGYFTCDRWYINSANTAGRLTMSQDSDGPSGFANCIKLDCTTADTSIASNESLRLIQRFEGQDLQRFAKGTSAAKEFTVSFYVKANAAFTFGCELFDNDNSRQISKTFSTTTDWVRHEITFPADTTGAFADDNALSLQLQFWLHAGSDFTSGTLNSTSWASNTDANRAVGIGSFFSSTSNDFYITGVQLEVGDTATDFEHRTFADELRRCQRYFEILYNDSESAANLAAFSTTTAYGNMHFIEKRADPTMIMSAASTMRIRAGGANTNLTSIDFNGAVKSGNGRVSVSVASGLTTGHAGWLSRSGSGTAYIHADAEL